jgi:hypothetical protein
VCGKQTNAELKMRELAPLLPGGEEYPWSSSRLIRRRPGVDDDDDGIDVQEDSSYPTPLAQYTAVDGDDGGDVIAEPPLSDLERLYSEYQHNKIQFGRSKSGSEGIF